MDDGFLQQIDKRAEGTLPSRRTQKIGERNETATASQNGPQDRVKMPFPERPLSIQWNTCTHNERCRDHCAAVDNQRGERERK